MTDKRSTTYARVRELLHYDPLTGIFTWRMSRGCVRAGTICSSVNTPGYIQIMIDSVNYRGHILAWFYMKGKWPEKTIDHEDLDKINNNWENLREASPSEQNYNTKIRIDNTSGYKGVCLAKNKYFLPWRAYINKDSKRVWHKYFHTAKEAHEARVAILQQLHGMFTNYG